MLELTVHYKRRLPTFSPPTPISLMTLLCQGDKSGRCSRLMPTVRILMALDLPPIGMSSFTPTAPAFLAPRLPCDAPASCAERSTFSVNLAVPAILNAGTYWVEIQANMTYSTQGEWHGLTAWSHRTTLQLGETLAALSGCAKIGVAGEPLAVRTLRSPTRFTG